MNINKFNKQELENLLLHDAEVTQILCDYDQHKIILPIKKNISQDINAEIVFENVIYFDMSFYEPWGPGIYISEVRLNENIDILERLKECNSISKDYFQIVILLNSGDKINIIASNVVYSEK
ncbi:MAG TPA: hypothetical protein VIK89_11320 [Cytophagaceae bacterium]